MAKAKSGVSMSEHPDVAKMLESRFVYNGDNDKLLGDIEKYLKKALPYPELGEEAAAKKRHNVAIGFLGAAARSAKAKFDQARAAEKAQKKQEREAQKAEARLYVDDKTGDTVVEYGEYKITLGQVKKIRVGGGLDVVLGLLAII